jgi:hypothetical protein
MMYCCCICVCFFRVRWMCFYTKKKGVIPGIEPNMYQSRNFRKKKNYGLKKILSKNLLYRFSKTKSKNYNCIKATKFDSFCIVIFVWIMKEYYLLLLFDPSNNIILANCRNRASYLDQKSF